jgi:manganese efflux pump family protein
MIELLVIAISLGLDAFSIAFAHGLCDKDFDKHAMRRLSFAFGSFQFFMPLLGFYLGRFIAPWLKHADIWVVAGILAIIGIHMIIEAIKSSEYEANSKLSKGWKLLGISVATSLDAWAVGFSFALLKRSIWIPSLIIGITASFMTIAGIWLGRSSQKLNIRKPGIWGGIALLGIAIKMILERLLI